MAAKTSASSTAKKGPNRQRPEKLISSRKVGAGRHDDSAAPKPQTEIRARGAQCRSRYNNSRSTPNWRRIRLRWWIRLIPGILNAKAPIAGARQLALVPRCEPAVLGATAFRKRLPRGLCCLAHGRRRATRDHQVGYCNPQRYDYVRERQSVSLLCACRHRRRPRATEPHEKHAPPRPRANWVGQDDHRHLLLIRAVISTGLVGARGVELSCRATGQVHCSKCSVIVSGINLVRMAYMCRSPLPRC